MDDGFGGFLDALVLHDAVCGACNQLFGDTIDRALTRGSPEGLERYRWTKDPKEIEHFDYSNVRLRRKGGGDFDGALFELRSGDAPGGLVAKLLPQVRIRKLGSDEWDDFTAAQIESGEWQKLQGVTVDWRLGIKIYGEGDAVERLTAVLRDQGVVPKIIRPLAFAASAGGEVTVEQEFVITPEITRAIAKIAFNYLAYREGADFVLAPAFDPIRRFIREAVKPELWPLHSDDSEPFRTNAPEGQRMVAHFVAVHDRHPAHRNLLGVVSLYGLITHTVVLAEDYGGLWPTPHAHFYNPKTKKAQRWQKGKQPGQR